MLFSAEECFCAVEALLLINFNPALVTHRSGKHTIFLKLKHFLINDSCYFRRLKKKKATPYLAGARKHSNLWIV